MVTAITNGAPGTAHRPTTSLVQGTKASHQDANSGKGRGGGGRGGGGAGRGGTRPYRMVPG